MCSPTATQRLGYTHASQPMHESSKIHVFVRSHLTQARLGIWFRIIAVTGGTSFQHTGLDVALRLQVSAPVPAKDGCFFLHQLSHTSCTGWTPLRTPECPDILKAGLSHDRWPLATVQGGTGFSLQPSMRGGALYGKGARKK